MKKIILPRLPQNLLFSFPKALATLFSKSTLERGQKNFLMPFHIQGYEKFGKTSRYKNIESVKADILAFCVELEAEMGSGPLVISFETLSELDGASTLFLDIAQRVFGWRVEVDHRVQRDTYQLGAHEKKIVHLLSFENIIPFAEGIDFAQLFHRCGDHWTCSKILEKLLRENQENSSKVSEIIYWLMKSKLSELNLDRALILSQILISSDASAIQKAAAHYTRAMIGIRHENDLTRLMLEPKKELALALLESDKVEPKDADYFANRAVLKNGMALVEYTKLTQNGALDRMSESQAAIAELEVLDEESYKIMLPVAISNQARIHFQAGNLSEAIILQEKALSLEMDYLENYIFLVKMYMASDQHEKAEATLRSAFRIHPGDPALYTLLAQLGIDEEKNYLTAIRFSAISNDSDIDRFNYCGWLHSEEKFEQCEIRLRELLLITQNAFVFENSASMLADILLKKAGPSAALDFLKKIKNNGRFQMISENIRDLENNQTVET